MNWFSNTWFVFYDEDSVMEDVVSTSSPAATSPSPAKNSTKNSPTPLKDPQQEAADQLNARITGAVALVAAAYRVPASVCAQNN